MKRRALLPIILLTGVLLGGLGTVILCNQGYCGASPAGQNESEKSGSNAVFGAGSFESTTSAAKAEAGSECEQVSTDRSHASALPIGTVAGRDGPRCYRPQTVAGLAVIGDSTADEYRADNPRGGEFGATTLNWVEVLVNERAMVLGEWGERQEPRRSGYAYNWARSGATSETMISSGQHTGVARQIQDGRVSHVIIQIGLNDFYYDDVALRIYDGSLQGSELDDLINSIIANAGTAVSTVRAAGDASVMLVAMQDYVTMTLLPEVAQLIPEESGRQRVTDAFARVNAGLRVLADREQVAFFDFNAALRDELEARQDPEDPRYILVDGVRIDKSARGNAPQYAMLDDEYAHPGTVLSALFANLFITEMNSTFCTRIDTVSDAEILRIAGLG